MKKFYLAIILHSLLSLPFLSRWVHANLCTLVELVYTFLVFLGSLTLGCVGIGKFIDRVDLNQLLK